MSEFTLKTVVRENRGKEVAKRLRRTGEVPAVIYGHGYDAVSLAVNAREMAELLKTAGESSIIEINIKPGKGRATKVQALIKDVQFDPVYGGIDHVDFLHVRMDEKITTRVPVVSVGEAPGVKAGGVLESPVWELDVECLPKDLPRDIKIDVSSLQIGDAIHVGDLALPEGVKSLTGAGSVVFHVVPPRIEKVEVAEGEEALALEAEAAAPAEPEVIGKGKKEEEVEEG